MGGLRDSGEGYRRRNYAIKKVDELLPNAELFIDEAPMSSSLDDLRDLLHSSPRLNLDKLISPPPRSIGPNVIGTDQLGGRAFRVCPSTDQDGRRSIEVADASPGITTEDLARDLEAVASKQGTPTDRDLLADLLKRVKRIEDHLGIAD